MIVNLVIVYCSVHCLHIMCQVLYKIYVNVLITSVPMVHLVKTHLVNEVSEVSISI